MILDSRSVEQNQAGMSDRKHNKGETKHASYDHPDDLGLLRISIVRRPQVKGYKRSQDEDAVHGGVKDEKDKKLVVVLTHTVEYPWAMVVHLQHTSLADTAMMCSLRLDVLAFAAPEGMALSRRVFGDMDVSTSPVDLCTWNQYSNRAE